MRYIACVLLALLGLVELLLRVVASIVLVCTIIGIILFIEVDLTDVLHPKLFDLAERCIS